MSSEKEVLQRVTLWTEGNDMFLFIFFFFFFWVQVHANLIVMEARLQAALLYILRAITHYMRWQPRFTCTHFCRCWASCDLHHSPILVHTHTHIHIHYSECLLIHIVCFSVNVLMLLCAWNVMYLNCVTIFCLYFVPFLLFCTEVYH